MLCHILIKRKCKTSVNTEGVAVLGLLHNKYKEPIMYQYAKEDRATLIY